MKVPALRYALTHHNTSQVSEATRIPPQTLERIKDGNHVPTDDEIDLLAGYFRGEFYLCGTDFQWKRNRTPNSTYGSLPTIPPNVPGSKSHDPWSPPPDLRAGPNPTGTGALQEGVTGTGERVRE